MSNPGTELTRQQRSVQTRSAPGRVSGKLKQALDLVVFEGLDPYEAASKLDLHARTMRLALSRKHVVAYLRQQREVFRSTASAQNIHHAVELRANARNEMARIAAMKIIEGVEEERQSRSGTVAAPGLTIVIQSTATLPTNVDTPAKPLINNDRDMTIDHDPPPDPALLHCTRGGTGG